MIDEFKFLGRVQNQDHHLLLEEYSKKLNRLAEIGVKILEKDMDRDTLGDEYLIPGLLFIRNQCEIVEGIATLIKDSLIDPCWPLLRISLETYLQLEYLLEDEENRARAFIVWNTHRNLSTYKRMDGISEEYKKLKAKFSKDRFGKGSSPKIYSGVNNLIENDLNILGKLEYKFVNEEFLRLKREKGKPNWYSLFNGPRNIEDLASRCNLEATYDIVYRAWSNYSHGTEIMGGKISSNEFGHLQIHQLRNPTQAKQVTLNCFNIVGLSFQTFVNRRVPSIKEEFKNWYLSIQAFHDDLAD